MAGSSPGLLAEEIKHLPLLVVEVDTTTRKNMVAALTAAGAHAVGAVSDGGEAWQAWKKSRASGVIIADWQLPEMTGLELLRRIRADEFARVQPAFVILAGEAISNAPLDSIKAGADGFLPMPFPPESLIPMVNESVAHRKQVSNGSAFGEQALESKILGSRPEAKLMFERYSTSVECEQLSQTKCVLRVENNYGLGTVLNLRFRRAVPVGDAFYLPLKGSVTKIERIPKEYGLFRLHLEFRKPVREHHGIQEILAVGGMESGPG